MANRAALVQALSAEMAPTIRRFVADAITPLVDRIKVLEARPLPVGITGGIKNSDGVLILTLSDGDTIDTGLRDGVDGVDGKDGKDGAPGHDGAPGTNGKDGSNGQDGKDGESLDPEEIHRQIQGQIEEATAALNGVIRTAIDQAVQGLPVPKDGKSPDPQEIVTLIRAAVSALPPAKDGRDGKDGTDGLPGAPGLPGADGKDGAPGRDGVDGKDGEPGRDGLHGKDGAPGADGKDGAPGPAGRDGIGLAGAMIDRSGQLVLTLTDGRTAELGVIVGRDGKDGKDGRDGTDGRDGADGAPGPEGLGFNDLAVTFEGRTMTVAMIREGLEKAFQFPVPIVLDRGVWKAGVAYEKGDGVSHGGSFWIAQADTTEKPETGKDWRLAVKRGRDGKDGERGPPGPAGPPGDKR